MPKAYRQLLIDSVVHDQLIEMRKRVSNIFTCTNAQFGLGSMIGLLLAHVANVPMDINWLTGEVAKMPKRGRPRTKKSEW